MVLKDKERSELQHKLKEIHIGIISDLTNKDLLELTDKDFDTLITKMKEGYPSLCGIDFLVETTYAGFCCQRIDNLPLRDIDLVRRLVESIPEVHWENGKYSYGKGLSVADYWPHKLCYIYLSKKIGEKFKEIETYIKKLVG